MIDEDEGLIDRVMRNEYRRTHVVPALKRHERWSRVRLEKHKKFFAKRLPSAADLDAVAEEERVREICKPVVAAKSDKTNLRVERKKSVR